MSIKRSLTVKALASRLGKDPARIRQIAIGYNIGEVIEGRIRRFSDSEALKIQRIIERIGRHSKNSKILAQSS